ncbi:hypothetical protein [Allomuricauda sp. ARW1Y1]|jgi:hypothetical protein|uniref:hypothetical protein n=1 Tax=Allomuricauda sp. ARW1Y1 TaxID=2663843 RepID=UPI0015C9FD04|nr:hypothetical protein [Muricauda sp. ARW1Y1]NYJ27327.1 hypothetical protein [Muricauda sp. ARW1Y1]
MNPNPNYPNYTYLKTTIIILMLMVSTVSLAQENALKLSKMENGEIKRTKFYNEGRRVKIITHNGEKYKGKFTILDNETLNIGNIDISLKKIKRIRLSGDGKVIAGAIALVVGASLSIYSMMLLSTEVVTFGLVKSANAGNLFLIGSALNIGGIYFLIENSPKRENWKIEIVQNE